MSEILEDKQTHLPFDPRMQRAVLGHLLLNQKFFEQAKHRIKKEWFNDPRTGRLFGFLVNFSNMYKRSPTVEELRDCSEMMLEKPEDISALRGELQKAVQETGNYGLDVIRKELTQWLHARIYQQSVTKSIQLYNEGEFGQCYEIVHDSIQQIRTTKFDEENEISFEDAIVLDPDGNPVGGYLVDQQKGYDDALTTGLGILDAALRPESMTAGGGLFRGDMTVLLAPSNVGKTTCMITMIAHNLLRGRSVLFMTHEGRPSDIREKILQAVLNVTKPELFMLYRSPEGLARLQRAIFLCKNYLTYIPYNRAGMTVEDVVPIIRRRHEQWAADNQGRGYDLLVSDYPAKLTTERAARGGMAKRNIDEIVYDYYVQLPLELGFHSLVAIQTNRQGSIANRDEARLLSMEDVLESWGVMTAATNVLSLNRDAQAAVKQRMTFYVCKSRSSETGRAVVARTRYAAGLTHSDTMGGTWYRGQDTMSDRIDDLLEKYKNQAIPEGTHSV